jgi:glycosyltransferase involved in cell wall biosynthesis
MDHFKAGMVGRRSVPFSNVSDPLDPALFMRLRTGHHRGRDETEELIVIATDGREAAARATPVRLAVDGRVLSDEYHGIGRLAEMILRKLAGRPDFAVTVFVRRQQLSDRFDVDDLVDGCGHARAIFDLPLTSPLQWVRWPAALRRVAAEITLSPYSLGGPLWGGGRRFTFIHDCIMESTPAFAPNRRTRLLYIAHTALVARRSEVLTRSIASARQIERFYRIPVPDWHVVPGGVDLGFVAGRTVRQYGGDRDLPANYLLQVGVRRPHKNVAALVRVLPHLPEDYHLLLVGTIDPRFPDPVPHLAHSLGVGKRVHHLPTVSEERLRAIYARATAFAYPSLVEGLGLPLLEAMAAGVPVVASDIPVFREVAGAAAILVPPADPQAWAVAFLRLQDESYRRQLIEAGVNRAREATWDLTAARLLAALRHD